MIKQLAFVLGEEKFRDGLRLYLKEHAYGNAEWSDLVHAFESVFGKSLENWAAMWIRHRGMPQVDVEVVLRRATSHRSFFVDAA